MTTSRRRFLQLSASAAALPAIPCFAWAQGYPLRPVTLVVGVGAGGAPGILARLICEQLSQRLGQPFIVENRPGAGGYLAMQAVMRAAPDGHTLLLLFTPHTINATRNASLKTNLMRDIAPVAGITRDTFVLVASPSMQTGTLAEFIAYAKANPGKINLASSGTGNLSHLTGEKLKMMAGIDMIHVPYNGAAQALAGLMAGNVQVMFDSMPSSLPHIRAGKLSALAVTSSTRLPALPDVPTIGELVPGYEVSGWLGVGAPADTPEAVVAKLNKEINAILADPEITARLAKFGSVALTLSPSDLGKLIAEETRKWAKVVDFVKSKSR